MAYTSLHDRLRGPIAKDLKKDLGIKNTYALPRIEKVVVNVGINKSKMDSKEMHAYVIDSLAQITGQKPVVTKARVAISNFKTREGMIVGAMVTLRGRQMEEFLDRLISYALPRIRDFRGVTTNFDGHGNYAIGIQDHSVFPEVPLPDAKQIFGLQVQITTTTDSDKEAKVLLKAIGMPFKKEQKEGKEEKEREEKEKALKVAKEEVDEEKKEQEEQEGQEEKKDNSEPESKSEPDTPSTN